MTHVVRYTSRDLPDLMDKVLRNSVGMDDYFNRLFSLNESTSNYPPYNVIRENENQFRLEIALAGFTKNQITVYTENNNLYVEGEKETDSDKEYVYHGLANRAFNRVWTITDDVEVKNVTFDDGLLIITLCKIIPEHQKKKIWF